MTKYCKLRNWMSANGFKDLKNMAPHEFKDTGRGLMATHSLSVGEVLLEVPANLIITSHTVMASSIGNILQRHQLTPLQALCVFLACERHKATLSAWSDYIASLPHTYTVPASWPSDLVNRLPPVLASDVAKQRDSVRALYEGCRGVIEELERSEPALRGAVTQDVFVWAWSTVNTRCVYWLQPPRPGLREDGEDHYALVPYLDMLNHSAHAQTEAGFDSASNCYRVTTLTPYNTGDQVFISYGPHSNKKLLLEYGFILPQNNANFIYGNFDSVCSVVKASGITDNSWKDVVTKNDLHLGLGFSEEGLTWSLLTLLKIAALPLCQRDKWTDCLEDGFTSEDHKLVTNSLVKAVIASERENHIFNMPATQCEIGHVVDDFCDHYIDLLSKCNI